MAHFIGISVVGITFACVLWYMWFLIDTLFRSHDLPTTKKAMQEVARCVRRRKGERGTFVDLGCARGRFAIGMAKELPAWKIRAVDMSRFRLSIAKIRAFFLRRRVVWERSNIFVADVSDVDVVYTYLWYDTMPPLEKKLMRELKPGAMVITNTSHFPEWKVEEEIVVHPATPDFERLYVYVKK